MQKNCVVETPSPAHSERWQRYFPLIRAITRSDWHYTASQFNQADFQPDAFIDFLVFHDLWPYLYHTIKIQQAASHYPAWLVIQLLGLNQRERGRSRQWHDALLELARAAKTEGVEIITLKGYPLAMRFYGDSSARRARDLDILVRPDDFQPICRILKTLGYRTAHAPHEPRWLRQLFAHAVEMERDGYVIDLHFCIRNRPAYNIDMDRLWHAKRPFTLAVDSEIELFTLSDEDTLLLLIVSIISDLELGHIRGKSFLDLYTIVTDLEERIDWSDFLQARREENLLAISVNVLNFVPLLFESGDRLTNLSAAIESWRHLVQVDDYQHALGLIGAPELCTQNRLWFLRLYPGSRVRYLIWLAAGILVKPGLMRHLQKGVVLLFRLLDGSCRKNISQQRSDTVRATHSVK